MLEPKSTPFKALIVRSAEGGQTEARLELLDTADLPSGDVLVRIDYSSLNFKDALGITGAAPIFRSFPMVPGIDLAGTVVESSDPQWQPGDQVVLNAFGAGETTWGGLAQLARVSAQGLVALPTGMTTRQAMIIGTAGYTAALCVEALVRGGLRPSDGEVLVTGATGGVGSFAVALLAQAGYKVVAVTGKAGEHSYLERLGASSTLARSDFEAPGKMLQMERWAGAIDCVGSHTLANVCAQVDARGIVAACGLAQGSDFPGNVMPFILRNIRLQGINCSLATEEERNAAWQRLATDCPAGLLDDVAIEIGLEGVLEAAANLIAGTVRGRILVNVN